MNLRNASSLKITGIIISEDREKMEITLLWIILMLQNLLRTMRG